MHKLTELATTQPHRYGCARSDCWRAVWHLIIARGVFDSPIDGSIIWPGPARSVNYRRRRRRRDHVHALYIRTTSVVHDKIARDTPSAALSVTRSHHDAPKHAAVQPSGTGLGVLFTNVVPSEYIRFDDHIKVNQRINSHASRVGCLV